MLFFSTVFSLHFVYFFSDIIFLGNQRSSQRIGKRWIGGRMAKIDFELDWQRVNPKIKSDFIRRNFVKKSSARGWNWKWWKSNYWNSTGHSFWVTNYYLQRGKFRPFFAIFRIFGQFSTEIFELLLFGGHVFYQFDQKIFHKKKNI